MTLDEFKARVSALGRSRGNGSFYGFKTHTKPKLNKRSRTTGLPWTAGEVSIRATFSAMLGVSYENAVNNAKERAGEERSFEAQKPFGKHYLVGSRCLLTDDKTETKYYVAVDKVGGHTRTFYVGERPATEAEIADLKENYLPKPSPSPYGVTWRTYGIESILEIT